MTTVLLMLSGCATTKSTEELLSQAGFKAMPANTPQQLEQLKSLPPHQISKVQRGGKQYYIYPDPGHNVLYVGQSAEYDLYKEIQYLKKDQREIRAESDVITTEAEQFSVWGDF